MLRTGLLLLLLFSEASQDEPILIAVPVPEDGCRADSPYYTVPWSGNYDDDLDDCT